MPVRVGPFVDAVFGGKLSHCGGQARPVAAGRRRSGQPALRARRQLERLCSQRQGRPGTSGCGAAASLAGEPALGLGGAAVPATSICPMTAPTRTVSTSAAEILTSLPSKARDLGV